MSGKVGKEGKVHSLDFTVSSEFHGDDQKTYSARHFLAVHIPHIPHFPRSNGPWSASAVPPPTPATRHHARTPLRWTFFPCLSRRCRQCPGPRHPLAISAP